jgi:hypothetical protein
MALLVAVAGVTARAQGYGGVEPPPPPIAEDGSIQWGTFYKSAAMQQAYERLWKLGACRGTNKRITVPVESNKMPIDTLPKDEFQGTVQAVSGTVAGGLIAFAVKRDDQPQGRVFVAQLHPAGVSGLSVTGPASAASIMPGMVVRMQALVDSSGRGLDQVETVEIVTPAEGSEPGSVVPDTRSEIVGRVVAVRPGMLVLQPAAGPLRRVFLGLSPNVVVRFDAAQVEYASPGDGVRITGRLWTGEGSMADGIVFADEVLVTKQP